MRGRLPDLVLAGVPKAGTSALARGLAARDDVYLPPDKEVHFFDDHRDRGLDWYRAQFPVDESTLAIDATPTYALVDDRITELSRTLPDARIILLLRHPVERFWSAYWYLRSLGKEPRSMRRVIKQELSGTSRLPYESIRTGFYPEVVERVWRCYPSDQVLVLLHDDLLADPEATYQRTCRFLGLDPHLHRHEVDHDTNATTVLRSFHLRYWSMRLHLFLRMPRAAMAVERWNRTDRRPPPLDADTRQLLLKIYETSIDRLEELLERDLSRWRQ